MFLVALIWGVNFSVTKGVFDTIPPFAFTGVRFALASLFLMPLVYRIEGAEPLPRGALVRLIVLGVVGNTLYQVCWISGESTMAVRVAPAPIFRLPPSTAIVLMSGMVVMSINTSG